MKKSLRSSSKRKRVINGALAFGAVALLTTGFATWIIGVQNNSTSASSGITVETATNQSVELTATLSDEDNTIYLGETEKVETGVVKENNPKGNLSITFSEVKLKYGDKWLASENASDIKGLNVRFATSSDNLKGGIGQNDANNLTDSADLINKRNSESYTYIDVDSNASTKFSKTAAGEPTKEGNLNVLTWSNITLTFEWGSFFEGISPANYYNSKFNTSTVTSGDIQNIQSELDAMKKAFMTNEGADPGTIVLYMEVEVTTPIE